MVSDREAYVADKVRKLFTFLIAGGGTWLLLRVLYRTAEGRQELWDIELLGFLVLVVIAVIWIRSTQRMSRRGASKRVTSPDGSAEADDSDD